MQFPLAQENSLTGEQAVQVTIVTILLFNNSNNIIQNYFNIM